VIDALAREGNRFEHAYTPCPLTLRSGKSYGRSARSTGRGASRSVTPWTPGASASRSWWAARWRSTSTRSISRWARSSGVSPPPRYHAARAALETHLDRSSGLMQQALLYGRVNGV